jgi:CRP/FNR family transcriptional regulator, cyclic AMP receptor protein
MEASTASSRRVRRGAATLGRIRVLEADRELGAALDRASFASASECCTARWTALTPRIRWSPHDPHEGEDQFGLLVVQGVLLHRLGISGRETVDLLGPGDLIRPWPALDEYAELFTDSRWQVLEPVELAGLDRRFLREAAPWPELLVALAERTAQHARSLALRLALSQIPQFEYRVQVMLWQLADRFGRVDRNGILVPLRLSHGVIAELVSVRRETVSRRLKELAERGVIVPDRHGWRLFGAPPAELLALARPDV